jgi:hypothetical protein
MKGLSLLQPWASLIQLWQKRIETRSWSTEYRGDLLICASKQFRGAEIDLCREAPFARALTVRGAGRMRSVGNVQFRHVATSPSDTRPDSVCLPLGAALCIAELVDVAPTTQVREGEFGVIRGEKEFGNYLPGRFAWRLRNIRRLAEPIAVKGMLGLWDVPDAVAERAQEETVATCQGCGCTENEACEGGCCWASANPLRCDRCESEDA